MTNERRKQINVKVQKKKADEQREMEAALNEEKKMNKVKLDRAILSGKRTKYEPKV